MKELLERYHEDGFVIIEGALPTDELHAVRAALSPYLERGPRGRNNFEGERTQRVYSLVGRGAVFERSVLHPQILALLDRLLDPGYLLTASQAISIAPGESPQPVHFDDAFYPLARPRKAVSVSTIWAVDDFTRDNGATEVIPGSHRWSDAEVAGSYRDDPSASVDGALVADLVPVEMPAGACVVFAGTLLHRGGENRSATTRTAFSHQYCEPWARQQENFFLTIPRERVAAMPEALRRLLGYSIHPPFMGQAAGRHPDKALSRDYAGVAKLVD